MGQANRNGTEEQRIAKAIGKESKHQKKARRFFHLCRFISPHATRESLISCGRNRGFKAIYEDHLPSSPRSKQTQVSPSAFIFGMMLGDLLKKY